MEKYNNCRINLLFSAENEGLSSARQVVLHTVQFEHRINVLLDLAVKMKFFHWRRTSVIRGAAQIAGDT